MGGWKKNTDYNFINYGTNNNDISSIIRSSRITNHVVGIVRNSQL